MHVPPRAATKKKTAREPWTHANLFVDETGTPSDATMHVVGLATWTPDAVRAIFDRAIKARTTFAAYLRGGRFYHAEEAASDCPGLNDFVLGELVALARSDWANLIVITIDNGRLDKSDRGVRAYCRALAKLVAIAPVHKAPRLAVRVSTLFNDTVNRDRASQMIRTEMEKRNFGAASGSTLELLPSDRDRALQAVDALAYAVNGRFGAGRTKTVHRGGGNARRSPAAALAKYVDEITELGRLSNSQIPPPARQTEK